ncbi:Putative ribonuclease H protein At1g65750 [Linum perenne]
MTNSATCCFWNNGDETLIHVLRDCTFASEVWNRFGIFNSSSPEWQGSSANWICSQINSGNGLLFGIICWYLWKVRNERIFTDKRSSPAEVVARAASWSYSVTTALESTRVLPGANRIRTEANIAWEPGPIGWVSLNTDGSVVQNQRKAAAGSIVRDHEGLGLLAFTMNLGFCLITRAEIRGALEGLNRAWDAGFRKVFLLMDSQAAISILMNESNANHNLGMEILEFQELKQRSWELILKHTFREGNRVADFLANTGYDYPLGSHTIIL